jgi:hypothetical protein
MRKNAVLILTAVVSLLFGAGVGFFGGMQYQKSQTQSRAQQFLNGNLQGRMGSGAARFRGNNNAQALRGEVISKDDKSITVKAQDGSTKIVILNGSTAYAKTTKASADDLTNGSQVTVFGTLNSDGSITAGSVQIGDLGMFGQRLNGSPSASPF